MNHFNICYRFQIHLYIRIVLQATTGGRPPIGKLNKETSNSFRSVTGKRYIYLLMRLFQLYYIITHVANLQKRQSRTMLVPISCIHPILCWMVIILLIRALSPAEIHRWY